MDINDVRLVILCEPPESVEDYILQSGLVERSVKEEEDGRKTVMPGMAVMLYDPRKSSVDKIVGEANIEFQHMNAEGIIVGKADRMLELITPPQSVDIAKDVADKITKVSDSVFPVFKSAAEKLLNNSGLTAVQLLTKALALLVVFYIKVFIFIVVFKLKRNTLIILLIHMQDSTTISVLTYRKDYVTLLLKTEKIINSLSDALRKLIPEDKVEGVKKHMILTYDGKGVVFDVAKEDLQLFLDGGKIDPAVTLGVVENMPPLNYLAK